MGLRRKKNRVVEEDVRVLGGTPGDRTVGGGTPGDWAVGGGTPGDWAVEL
ncbi:hypothetical protein G3I28_17765, partial [Streptomyces sp. SID10116]|nr:hypothetical protein [Streptomyces sp. SID10116]